MKRKAIPGKQNFGLYKYEGIKKDTYSVRREAAGKEPLDQKLRADNLADARREAADLVRGWLGLKPKISQVKLIEELWNEWVETKADKSSGTRDSIRFSGKHLLPFFGPYLPSEINSNLWERYILKKRETSPTRRFFNEQKWFSMFLLSLHDNGIIERRVRIRNPDTKSTAGRVLSEEEVLSLLAHAPGDLHLQILMSYTMGTRDNENKCLFWVADHADIPRSHVDLDRKSIVLLAKDTKIRRGRIVPLSADAHEELRHRKSRALGVAVFPSKTNPNDRTHRQSTKGAWTRCRLNAGVKCRFHDIRHTYLTNAFRNAKGAIDSMLICNAAGLSIEEAQATYLHFNLEDLKPVAGLVGLRHGSADCREIGGEND